MSLVTIALILVLVAIVAMAAVKRLAIEIALILGVLTVILLVSASGVIK